MKTRGCCGRRVCQGLVYAYHDARGAVVYVGKAVRYAGEPHERALERRTKAHVTDITYSPSMFHDWLRTHRRARVSVLSRVNGRGLCRSEQRWINRLRKQGAPLLNGRRPRT